MLPGRVLMTTDAVGGVWRHALDLARSLNETGIHCLLVGLGPSPADRSEADALAPSTQLVWTELDLDWMQDGHEAVADVGRRLAEIAYNTGIELLHLNLPSQAVGIPEGVPVVVMSHSCLPTWWAEVRGGALPDQYRWHLEANRIGMRRADAVVAPSRSHADAITQVYGPVDRLAVLHNATGPQADGHGARRRPVVLAAARWWDAAKNVDVLDRAAATSPWTIELAGALSGPDGSRIATAHAATLGTLPAEMLRARMREAEIFASPSLYEPFGLVALEAASRGCALLLADIPTYRELWQGAARFVSPVRPELWSDAIAELAADPDQRLQLREAARQRAAGFTSARQRDGLLAIYQATMERGTRLANRIQ